MSRRVLTIWLPIAPPIGLLALVFAFAPGQSPTPATTAPTAAARGIALGLFAAHPDFDYGPMIAEIADRGAQDVLIVVPWYQQSIHATHIEAGDAATARRVVDQARRAGLRVALMPIIRLRDRSNGAWRGQIDAAPAGWFTAYDAALLQLARAVDDEAMRLVVGSELTRMARHTARWRHTIAQVRGAFAGQLTFSANWDAYQQVEFWDALDHIGLTGYFPIEGPDLAGMRASWRAPLADARRYARAHKRPLIFTEVGYPNHRQAARRPWDQHADSTPAPALQARLLRVACDAITAQDGLYIWNWFGRGGPRQVEFSPRGKPAASMVEACLTRRGS
ncbi:MAG: hypothetical protein ACI9U2_003414 [Bradymonadia bacterium]|jgi:hypothetical protein